VRLGAEVPIAATLILCAAGVLGNANDPRHGLAICGTSQLHNSSVALAQIRNMTGALRPTLDKHMGKTADRFGEGMPARWALTNDEAAN
jgi:hypothetical protein